MQIVMFSVNPLFPDTVMGGAPKHLQNIAIHMGQRGHQVTVLCTRASANMGNFKWHDNVTVKPILRFHQPFPQPYAIPAYDMATAIQDVSNHLQTADRFYMHDGEFLYPYVYKDVPTVISLRDNVYPETLLGGFHFQAHKLVLISEYSRQYFQQTVGRFFPELSERIEVIHNGLDWQKFKPTKPDKILDYVPIKLEDQPILLHPHRPEESKGIMQTIDLVNLLVNERGFSNLIALAPRWHDVQASSDLREFYGQIEQKIADYNLQDNFIFHGWIPQELMPEYFSLGTVTVSLGYFPESFGNAVYESMGCGTPTIAARISTHRELLPDTLIDKVDYGDIGSAAEIASEIIRSGRRTSPQTLDYLHQNYGIERQLNAYAEVIENAQIATPMVYRHPALTADTRYQLGGWCYVSQSRGIYHDFNADYLNEPALIRAVQQFPDGFTQAQAQKMGISESRFEFLYRACYLVPII